MVKKEGNNLRMVFLHTDFLFAIKQQFNYIYVFDSMVATTLLINIPVQLVENEPFKTV